MNMSLRSRRKNVHTRTCRICLKVDLLNGVIIGSEGPWLELFEYCFGIPIKPKDACKRLCGECADKINEFSEFKKLALRSNKLWQSIKVSCISTNNALPEKIKSNNQLHIKNSVQSSMKDSSEEHKIGELDTEIIEIEDDEHSENNKQDVIENIITMICEPQNDTIEEIEEEPFEPLSDNIEDNEEESFEHQNDTKEEIKEESFTKKGLFYICETCKKTFRTKLLLKTHFIKKKCKIPTEKHYYCGLCDVILPDEEKLKQHVTGHCLNNELSCKLCDYVGRDFADMTMHRYSHMPKGSVKTIMCHLFTCKKKFNAQLALQYHYRVAHLKKTGGLCSVCNKQFASYKSWRNHEKWHRSSNYICDTCGRKFLYKHSIIRHVELHSDYKRYICHACGKGFKRYSNLKLHLVTVHDNSKVKCKHCNYVFKNQKGLELHMRKIADGFRHPCKECSKSFPTGYLLKRHMIWHTDERPYVCNVCGLSYKTVGQLKIHMRKHTGVMPYKCEYCNRCFPSSNQLKVHVAVHTGQRNYKCSYCPRSFHGKKLLIEHCAKVHSGMEVPKEVEQKLTESNTQKESDSQKQSS